MGRECGGDKRGCHRLLAGRPPRGRAPDGRARPPPHPPAGPRAVPCGRSLLRSPLSGAGSRGCSAGRPSSEGSGFGVLEGEGCLRLEGRTCDCWDGGFYPCPERSATWKLVAQTCTILGGAGSSPSFAHFSVGLLCPRPPKGWRDLEGWPRPLLGRVLSLFLQRDSTGRACVTCSWLFVLGINMKTEEAPPEDTGAGINI